MIKQSIKTNIFTLFILTIITLTATLLFTQYNLSSELAIKNISKEFNLISNNILTQIKLNDKNTENMLIFNKENEVYSSEINFNEKHNSFKSISLIMELKENITSMYFAHKNGDFYAVTNMKKNKSLYSIYKAPKNTFWTTITMKNNKFQYTFFDKNKNKISSYFINGKFNPLIRPWYINTKSKFVVNKTKPYIFKDLNKPGISYSIKLNENKGVLGIDYTINSFNKFLTNQKNEADLFLFNREGTIFVESEEKEKEIDKRTKKIKLNEKEKRFIEIQKELLVSNDNWAPFDFFSIGKPMGYGVDILNKIGAKTGLKFKYVNGIDWDQLVRMFKNKDLDIMNSLFKTKEREVYGLFSEKIYSFKNYFIKNKSSKIRNLDNFNISNKFGLVKGWSIELYMLDKYPNLNYIYYKDIKSLYIALNKGEIDLIVENEENLKFHISELYLDRIEKGDWFKSFDKGAKQSLYIMVQKDNKLLLSIINKGLNSISEKEQKNIYNKWFNGKKVKSTDKIDKIDKDLFKIIGTDKNNIKYVKDSVEYLSTYVSINEDLYLGLKISTKRLMLDDIANIKKSMLIAIIIFILFIPAIYVMTGFITNPIRKLIKENDKINKRDFSSVKKIKTNIYELEEFSDSFVSMSKNIKEYQDNQEELLDSIIKLIAEAIDNKSKYTGGHCERVPKIAELLLDAANENNDKFKDFKFDSKDQRREFHIAAWLHDCGKVTTPEYVIDKAVKLETIYNRIHEIRTRFEVLQRDLEIKRLKGLISTEEFIKEDLKLEEDFEFIAKVNKGTEFMDNSKINKVKEISKRVWKPRFNYLLGLSQAEEERLDNIEFEVKEIELLSDKSSHIIKRESFNKNEYLAAGFKLEVPEKLYDYGEIYNLTIQKGTLTKEERYKINEHVIMTIKMLEKIPFPKNLKNIPYYAGTHHETLIGTGYPRALEEKDLSIPARIMVIADIFEALTASDRPYKKAKTLEEALTIMRFMVKDKHMDKDLFDLFIEKKIYKKYLKIN